MEKPGPLPEFYVYKFFLALLLNEDEFDVKELL
jgi:hypothetical protein